MTELYKKRWCGSGYKISVSETQKIGNQMRYQEAIETMIQAVENGYLDGMNFGSQLLDHDYDVKKSGKKIEIINKRTKVRTMDEISDNQEFHRNYLLDTLNGLQAMMIHYYESVLDKKHIQVKAKRSKIEQEQFYKEQTARRFKQLEQQFQATQNEKYQACKARTQRLVMIAIRIHLEYLDRLTPGPCLYNGIISTKDQVYDEVKKRRNEISSGKEKHQDKTFKELMEELNAAAGNLPSAAAMAEITEQEQKEIQKKVLGCQAVGQQQFEEQVEEMRKIYHKEIQFIGPIQQ